MGTIIKKKIKGTNTIIMLNPKESTCIDTVNPSVLVKRGHDKAKRNDLKTVGLALLVTPDFFRTGPK